MNLTNDLVVMLNDFGVSVALSSAPQTQTKALVDSADEAVMANGNPSPFIGRSVVLTLRTGALDVREGTELTFGGHRYVVREKYQIEDGLLTRLLVVKA